MHTAVWSASVAGHVCAVMRQHSDRRSWRGGLSSAAAVPAPEETVAGGQVGRDSLSPDTHCASPRHSPSMISSKPFEITELVSEAKH